MIILDELPFRFVEKEGFNGVMREACPMFKMSSRRTIREDCLNRGRVSLTTDCWTSIQNFSYLCLIAHFIGDDWKLHKKIISFPRIFSHKGCDIGAVIASCLEEWNLKSIFSITVDNASSNDTAIFHLTDTFKKWGTQLLDGKYVHMRCIAHITNLIVGDGLEEVAISVRRVCEAVRYVRSSPARWAQFKECVSLQKIQSKKLVCLDVATRWNSTYLMLEVAVAFENSFVSYESVDFEYKSDLRQKKYKGSIVGPPAHADWESVRNLLPYLQFFYDMTVLASGTSYVTAHLFLGEVTKVFLHIREMERSDDEDVRRMADKMLKKVTKYWCEEEGDNSRLNKLCYIAVVFDPRHKLDFPRYAFVKLYGQRRGTELMQEMMEDLNELFSHYEDKHKAANASPNLGNTSRKQFFPDYLVPEVVSPQSDLAIYLSLPREETSTLDNPNNQFDILDWWKNYGVRYPVLSDMVKDILAVPISTVPSESAFSTSGRVLDSFRSSLTSKIVEALVCAEDWIRSSNLSLLPDEEDMDDLEELEEGNIILFLFLCIHFGNGMLNVP
ncbi:Putative AC transposase [Linum grandiflorum]